MKARRHECPHRDAETTDQILLSQWGVPQQSRHLPRWTTGQTPASGSQLRGQDGETPPSCSLQGGGCLQGGWGALLLKGPASCALWGELAWKLLLQTHMPSACLFPVWGQRREGSPVEGSGKLRGPGQPQQGDSTFPCSRFTILSQSLQFLVFR